MHALTDVVTIEPWSPWPLVFPGIAVVVAIMASVVGTRYSSKPMREGGYALFVVGALACAWMAWSMSGLWDANAREAAFAGAGYESPTFSGNPGAVAGELPPIAWQAVRDGERVRGVLHQVDGDRWEISEISD
jgi:hypothetical protein